jgi:crotonobetainyl-CoA:carnitine CoA-transferase CaiB-like acyl-CoA transferase
MTAALEGLRVVDASSGIAGQFCARLMADYGADVVLVEPPGGTPTRRDDGIEPDPERASALFLHLNQGKRSVVDDGPLGSSEHTRELVRRADIAVVDGAADCADLARRHPSLIVVHVTEYGHGQDALDDDEMLHHARAGTMYANGSPDQPPLFGTGHRARYTAGLAAYTGALAALIADESDQRGQVVEVAVCDVAITMNYNAATQFLQNGTVDLRDDAGAPEATLPCIDGWIGFFPYNERWEPVCRALGAAHLLDDPRFADADGRHRHRRELDAELASITGRHLVDQLVDRLRAAGQVAARARTVGELLESPHLHERGFWRSVETDEGPRTVMRPPFLLSATPALPPRRAPERGAA